MEAVIEKECSALGGLFHTVIGDMKEAHDPFCSLTRKEDMMSSCPIWEDFITKAGKLQSQLRATAVAVTIFLDAFQKVADLATNSRGGTRDIGSALTRMCMRHRSIEAKLKQFSMCFLEGLINPLQEQMEEWKRGVNTLDKDHAKEYKRARQEIKKKSSDTLKLQKKAKKADNHGRGDFQPQLNSAMQDVSDKYILLEETEKQALRKALIEERQRFCCFVALLQPVVDEEISMLAEVTHLQTISEDLKALTSDPHKLPPASEQVISDLKGSDYGWSYQTPPSSPSTTMSRKSSMCSSLNSVNSSDSRGSSGSHSHSPSSSSSSSSSHHLFHHHHPCHRYRSSTLPLQAPVRLSSISSHDSGFISSSQDQNASSKSSSPMPAETKPCPSSSSSEMSETGQLHGDCSTACSLTATTLQHATDKDWAKPGPYDQPMVNTLRRRKDKEALAGVENNGSINGGNSPPSSQTSISAPPPAQIQTPSQQEEKNRIMKADDLEAQNELALALSRGLELDTQRSNRDSIQCSSGYSTQTNTPCCSEDTIPSQSISDYDYFSMAGDQEPEQQQPEQPSDFDKSSTIPRNSDIGQSYRRMFQTKRPASTAGMPITQTPYPGQGTYHGGAYPSTPVHTGTYPSAPAGQYTATSTGHGPVIVTPGVATIRRTPSSKPCARRSGSVGGGPIPIRTPVVPVKIPTVPDMSGTVNGSRSSEEIGGGEESSYSSTFVRPDEAGTLPLMSWSGQASTNPPTVPLPNQLVQPYQGSGEEADKQDEGNMLVAIRKGVKLKRTLTNDRSAPRIA
ncbi:metastasis suppressor protein 1-like isoform X10 [Xiphophorus couchianus]|uniref:metastasis suppressor protein 1-like isoform X10 n=1 Tax=Xiphophorus couchianus TaxID=32473 RepID=UPI001016C4DB|nr:metastasis suppressor protein 1-like isoform X10 [Xiphophorus couchianus]